MWEFKPFRHRLRGIAASARNGVAAGGDGAANSTAGGSDNASTTPSGTAVERAPSSTAVTDYFAQFRVGERTPFDDIAAGENGRAGGNRNATDDRDEEDVFEDYASSTAGGAESVPSDDDEDDVADELKQQYVDEDGEFDSTTRSMRPKSTGSAGGHEGNKRLANRTEPSYRLEESRESPVVTNVALNLLRLMGKYLRMVPVLDTIAFDVVEAMTHLLGYYFYSVSYRIGHC